MSTTTMGAKDAQLREAQHERDEARANQLAALNEVTTWKCRAEQQICMIEEISAERDEARAQADRLQAVLISKHGGEPLALLSELDEARAQLAQLEVERKGAENIARWYQGCKRERDEARTQLAQALLNIDELKENR